MSLYKGLKTIKELITPILPCELTSQIKPTHTNQDQQFCVLSYQLVYSQTNICNRNITHYNIVVYVVDSEIVDTDTLYEKAEQIRELLSNIHHVEGIVAIDKVVVSNSGVYLNGKEAVQITGEMLYDG